MTFSIAPYDRLAKAVTLMVCILLLAIGFIPHMLAFVWALEILIVLACYAYSPKGYEVTGRSIAVKRLIGDVQFSLDGLREARAAGADDFRGCIRLWGNGGMFGYYGIFRTSKLGKSIWYLTDKSKAVVVITDAKTALFSPADTDGFLQAIGAPASAPSTAAAPSGGIPAGTAVGIAGVLVGLAAMALVFLFAPGPPSYTLTHDALTIHDRFYSVTLKADAVDAAKVRVVDFNREPEWRPTLRTNGFANEHYQSGWFRLANGETVEMYRAGGDRLVLLPGIGAGATVLYQARNPEQFAAEIRREWVR
jgi:hypothetical protein